MSKFLTYEERLMIAQGLKEHKSFGVIAKELSKDRTTIAKEIKRHSAKKKSGCPGYPYNVCLSRTSCKAKRICAKACSHESAYECSICPQCTEFCQQFKEEVCTMRFKPPYVCNGCQELNQCTSRKGSMIRQTPTSVRKKRFPKHGAASCQTKRN